MKVWVLDLEGYDAGGGNARVFSTLEAAKAAVDHVTWKLEDDGEWTDVTHPGSTGNTWLIYERVVDESEW